MTLKEHTESIESGLPWAPKLPKHWNRMRMKHLFKERTEKGYPNEPLLTASQSHGVIKKSEYRSRTVEAMKDLHLLKLVEPGDYVISLRSFQGGIEFAHCRGIISPAYTVLTPNAHAERGFFEHFFKSEFFIQSMTLFVTGIREGQNIDYERLSRAYLPVPPIEEQEKIGSFIRHIDHRVNKLIKAKKRLIELLNEQKQAIIHEAVTKGLDPSVPMKDSGIEWLGEIPEHWEACRFRRLVSRIDQGVSPQAEALLADNGSWGVLKAGCSNGGKFNEIQHKRLPNGFQIEEKYTVKIGDIILSRASGSPRLVGSASRVEALNFLLILSDKTFRPVLKQPMLADFIVATMTENRKSLFGPPIRLYYMAVGVLGR